MLPQMNLKRHLNLEKIDFQITTDGSLHVYSSSIELKTKSYFLRVWSINKKSKGKRYHKAKHKSFDFSISKKKSEGHKI